MDNARYCMNCGAELGPAEAWLCFYCEEYERDQKKHAAEQLQEHKPEDTGFNFEG